MHFCMSAMAAIIPNSSANKNMCLPNKSICGYIINCLLTIIKLKDMHLFCEEMRRLGFTIRLCSRLQVFFLF
jgi:hypothetical protein